MSTWTRLPPPEEIARKSSSWAFRPNWGMRFELLSCSSDAQRSLEVLACRPGGLMWTVRWAEAAMPALS